VFTLIGNERHFKTPFPLSLRSRKSLNQTKAFIFSTVLLLHVQKNKIITDYVAFVLRPFSITSSPLSNNEHGIHCPLANAIYIVFTLSWNTGEQANVFFFVIEITRPECKGQQSSHNLNSWNCPHLQAVCCWQPDIKAEMQTRYTPFPSSVWRRPRPPPPRPQSNPFPWGRGDSIFPPHPNPERPTYLPESWLHVKSTLMHNHASVLLLLPGKSK